jgi:hypothetical protein
VAAYSSAVFNNATHLLKSFSNGGTQELAAGRTADSNQQTDSSKNITICILNNATGEKVFIQPSAKEQNADNLIVISRKPMK